MPTKEIMDDLYVRKFISENKITQSLVDAYKVTISDVIDSRNKCENCKGLKDCKQKSIGERLALEYQEGYRGVINIVYKECAYKIQDKDKQAYLHNFLYSDIPMHLKEIDLNDISLLDEYQIDLCANLQDILDKKSNKGLYIVGKLGVGKTYLCIALANSLAKANNTICFVKANSAFNDLRFSIQENINKVNILINKLEKCDYLFLDDLGRETASNFIRDNVLFRVLDYRMENKKMTIINTNFSKKELREHYTYNHNEDEINGEGLMERINKLTNEFVLKGENKRG